jgi:CheY-like chemotaxis protein
VEIVLETDVALQKMADRRPDLVVLDVMFPESSSAGFELARQMRKAGEEIRNIPILMLTAVNARFPLGFSARDIDDAWLPVTAFLEKPVNFDLLRGKVAAMLPKQNAESHR